MTAAQLRLRLVERLAMAGGRACAVGLHPVIAWRRRPAMRMPMVAGYVVASYVIVLWALLVF